MPRPHNAGATPGASATPHVEHFGAQQPQVAALQALGAAAGALAHDPEALLQKQLELFQAHLALGANVLGGILGQTVEAVAKPAKGDGRFAHEGWNSGVFDLLKQSYLLTGEWLTDTVGEARGLDAHTRMQALFYTRNLIEAFSPSNFFATNPEAIATALTTQGQSILDGAQNFLADLKRGKISMTDYSKFEVGKNLAVTPGQVVFKNRLIELIQYTPATKQVRQRPLLICPPWINRFYILDLQAQNSLVKYLVDEGFQVFMISWKNPDASYRDTGFEDYVEDGYLTAVDAVLAITGQKSLNSLAYCIGGTLQATSLAILNSKGDTRVNAAGFLTSLVDFKEAGELSVFIDEAQVAALEERMAHDGILDGKAMAGTFSAMRAADLIWSFVTSNYLLGKQPFPFDILYWNDDSTCMPAAMHSWYLRNLYLYNKLVQPGALTLLGTPLDITNITQPLYMVGALNDHITPWHSTYAGFARMRSAHKRYALSRAGHVAGVVNPPTPQGKPVKRSFWVGEAAASTGQAWLDTATETQDSWWPDYSQWLADQSGDFVPAPAKAGSAQFKPLGAAPGSYVKEH
jgi:polyhydroxyalkanoate synthase